MKMKKYVSLVLAAFMMLLCLTACGGVPSEFKGHLMARYIEQIQDGSYTYESSRLNDKSDAKTTFCKVDDDKVMVTIAQGDSTACLMKNGDNYYVISPAQFAYTDATGATKKQIVAYTTSLSIENWVGGAFVEEGTEKVKGTAYQYEDYYIASTQKRTRYFFDEDDNLVMVGVVNSKGKVDEYLTMNIYSASESAFNQLNSYHYYDKNGNLVTTTTAAK